jgi:hypothetical protein
MENFLLNLGLSFTFSKILTYLLFVILGLLLTFLFIKKSKNNRIGKVPKLLISIVLLVFPFLIYFAIHPIYEGDFSNNAYSVASKVDFPKKKQLTIIALANCPYCIQSIETSKLLKKKNPSICIEYWVLSTDLKDKAKYQKLLKSIAKVKLKGKNADELTVIAKGSYPTFVISNKHKAIKAWNNDSFGVRAMDEVCSGY